MLALQVRVLHQNIFLNAYNFGTRGSTEVRRISNDHKSKGYPSETSEAAFTMQKADKGDLRLAWPPLK